jgi:hypothetical protein
MVPPGRVSATSLPDDYDVRIPARRSIKVAELAPIGGLVGRGVTEHRLRLAPPPAEVDDRRT